MVVSDHHSASPQESIVLPGRPRSTNHNAVPPASTTRPETAVTITARRTTTAQVMRGRGEDMSPSSGANGRSGDTATATRLRRVRHPGAPAARPIRSDRKSTRLNSSHANISYAVFCLKKKNNTVPSKEPSFTKRMHHAEAKHLRRPRVMRLEEYKSKLQSRKY